MAVNFTPDGYVYNKAGTPLVGLTVNAYRIDTGALVATTTTVGAGGGKGAGYWVFPALEDTLEYRIEIVLSGSQKLIRTRFSAEMQHLGVRGSARLPASANVFLNNVAISSIYAPIATPTFTGNMTVPTINGGTPITSLNISAQAVSSATNATNSAALGGVAAANYSQTSHNHAGVYATTAHGHTANGFYTGDGSGNRHISCGFTPRVVHLVSAFFRTDVINGSSAGVFTTLHNITAGTITDYSNIISITVANGFNVAIPGAVGEASGNAAGVIYGWVAIP